MTSEIIFRQMKPEDGQAISKLSGQCSDSAGISVVWEYHTDAFQAFLALNPSTVGFVAELPKNRLIIGVVILDFINTGFYDETRDGAYFRFLKVHPAHRRRGVAARLIERAVEYVNDNIGDNATSLARIQDDNKWSLASAKKWDCRFLGNLATGVFKALNKAPLKKDIVIQEADVGDFDEIAAKLNVFYQGHVFFVPQTGLSLKNNIGTTFLGKPLRHCLVAKSKDGNILAGLEATREYDLRVMKILGLPFFMSLANRFVRLVPVDGKVRLMAIKNFWFEPGQMEAASTLWSHARWKWRRGCNALGISFDTRSPLASVCKLPFYISKNKFKIAIKAPVPIDQAKLVFPVV